MLRKDHLCFVAHRSMRAVPAVQTCCTRVAALLLLQSVRFSVICNIFLSPINIPLYIVSHAEQIINKWIRVLRFSTVSVRATHPQRATSRHGLLHSPQAQSHRHALAPEDNNAAVRNAVVSLLCSVHKRNLYTFTYIYVYIPSFCAAKRSAHVRCQRWQRRCHCAILRYIYCNIIIVVKNKDTVAWFRFPFKSPLRRRRKKREKQKRVKTSTSIVLSLSLFFTSTWFVKPSLKVQVPILQTRRGMPM